MSQVGLEAATRQPVLSFEAYGFTVAGVMGFLTRPRIGITLKGRRHPNFDTSR